jgi:hypothetical protein
MRVVRITNLVITSAFNLALIALTSFASFAVKIFF